MHPMIMIAIQAVRQAGTMIINSYYGKPECIEIITKNKNDLVTNVDIQAEQLIIEIIRSYYPTHTIITEESGCILGIGETSNIHWIIDPLDGTTNFAKKLPHFSISIAVRIKNTTEFAVIYNPILNELFTAVRGQGAKLNGSNLIIKNIKELDGVIIATGFPFKAKQHSNSYINIVRKLFKKCADFRRTGSAALDLAYVAAGRVDFFFEIGLKPWDFMAGELLVRESGGIVTDFIGRHNYISSGNILAGCSLLVTKILSEIKPELTDILKI